MHEPPMAAAEPLKDMLKRSIALNSTWRLLKARLPALESGFQSVGLGLAFSDYYGDLARADRATPACRSMDGFLTDLDFVLGATA